MTGPTSHQPKSPATSRIASAMALVALCLNFSVTGACWSDTSGSSLASDASDTAYFAALTSTAAIPAQQRPAPLLAIWHQIATLQQSGHHHKAAVLQQMLAPYSLLWRRQGKLWLRCLFAYQGPLAALETLGIRPDLPGGPIYTAWVPVSQIDALLRLKGLTRAGISRRLQAHLNVSAPLVFAPQARFQHGVDGRGVIVGIIDTGIDLAHPAFRNEDGTTRVLAILDFSQQGETPALPLVLTAKEIDQALQEKSPLRHKDDTGHGTHVAGIAAGNGRTDDPSQPIRYMGIAPRADLVIVKGVRQGQSDFNSADVLQGIRFIHQTASALGKPYVINLSLGGHQGGHDGATLLEQAIEPFTGPNRPGQIVVASAGNEGDDRIHASGWLAKGEAIEVPLSVPSQGESGEAAKDLTIALEIWFPLAGRMTLAVRSPRGHETRLFAPVEATQTAELFELEDGNLLIQARTETRQPQGRSYSIVLSARSGGGLQPGEWLLRLGGETSRFDAWIAETVRGDSVGQIYFGRFHTQEMLVGLPASSSALLTVGAYNSRSGWASAAGEIVTSSIRQGALASFSSVGPTRDGRPKPDLVAPGVYIAAPAPLSLPLQAKGKVADAPYRISQGTSQAAPHLTGGMALLLQLHPTLTIDQARHWLHRTSATDAWTQEGAVYQRQWGFGKLHLLAALNALQLGGSLQAADPRLSTLGLLQDTIPADGQSTTSVVVIPKDRQGVPLAGTHRVQIHTTAGTLGPVEASQPGIYQATLRASSRPGTATITALIDGTSLSTQRTLSFVPASNAPPTGCHCQTYPSNIPSFWQLAWLFLLGWGILRRQS